MQKWNIGDTVVHGRDGVCVIEDITEMTVADGSRPYYVLSPVYDKAIIRQGEVEGKKLSAGSASSLYGGVASGYYNININQSGSTVTVSGTINAPYSFYGLFVDLTLVAPVTGSSVNESINMNQFDTGYHTVSLAIIKGSDTTIMDLIGRKYMSSNTIAARPTYYGKFQVYSNYFTYY